MLPLILIITFIFSLIAFESNIPSSINQNLLNNYFLNAFQVIGNHSWVFLFGFAIVAILIFRSLKFEIRHFKKNHLLIVFTQALFVFVTGIFFSLFVLLILAVLELNILAVVIDINPKLLGIQTDINQIKNTLLKLDLSPMVVASNGDYYKELQSIALATTGTDSFYGKYILSSIPNILVIPTGKISSTVLIDNTVIISEIKKKDLEQITPTITYVLIKNYFSDRAIKHFPKVSIMNSNEYSKFRQDDYANKLKTIADQLNQAQQLISSTSALIQTDKDKITANQDLIGNTYSQKDKIYAACIAKGAYDGAGRFVKTNSQSYCQSEVANFDNTILTANDQLDKSNKDLAINQQLLKTYQIYANFFSAEGRLTNSLKVNIPNELGLFVPNDTLKIILNTGSVHGIADYFETVTHEYLHYASHNQNNKTLTLAFFEEGLTEYFSRNIIKDSLDSDTSLGYPVFVKIISQITKIIPESELADIYFSKDEVGLENALDRVYGDNFYKNNLLLFETLQFTSNNTQLLQFANSLMAKIGGKPLKEQDLISAPFDPNL